MRYGDDIIADFFRGAGFQVRQDGGWVYVTHNDKELWIGAEYGVSLDAEVRVSNGQVEDQLIEPNQQDSSE